jgi:hypothetical protein
MKNKGLYLNLLGALILAATFISCAPSIPHAVDAQKQCVTCHGNNGVKPYPAWHAERSYTNDDCSGCHDLKIDNRNMAGATTK